MAFVTNQIIGQAVRGEFKNQAILLQLAAEATNTSLAGKGAGDTIRLTTFGTLSEGLQELDKGELITFEELAQTAENVKIKVYGKGVKIFDQDVKFSVSGGSLETEATRQLTEIFARGLDTAALEAIMASGVVPVDATGGLTSNAILGQILKVYGEAGMDAVGAILVHPTVASQLLTASDVNFARGDVAGYQAQYRNEIGRLFNKIPVVMTERVASEVVGADTIYKTVVLPKDSLLYVLGEDVQVESDRNIAEKATYFAGDIYYAIHLTKDPVIFNTKAQ